MAETKMKEKISALMDGEVDELEMQQLIRELRSNPEHSSCWEQYHVIGDALRNNLSPCLDRSFASSISQAIARENLPATVVSTPPEKSKAKINKRHAIMNPFSGFAIAASVAMVAYLGVGMIAVDEQLAGPSLANTIPQTAPATSVAQSMPQSGFSTVQGQQWNTVQPAVESRLKHYLYNHRNVAGSAAMSPSVMPQARLLIVNPGRGE